MRLSVWLPDQYAFDPGDGEKMGMRFECLNSVDGIPTTVVAFTTDIPALGGQWGEPFLIGPGSIHVAHTNEEHVEKSELTEAVQIYIRMVKELCKRASK